MGSVVVGRPTKPQEGNSAVWKRGGGVVGGAVVYRVKVIMKQLIKIIYAGFFSIFRSSGFTLPDFIALLSVVFCIYAHLRVLVQILVQLLESSLLETEYRKLFDLLLMVIVFVPQYNNLYRGYGAKTAISDFDNLSLEKQKRYRVLSVVCLVESISLILLSGFFLKLIRSI